MNSTTAGALAAVLAGLLILGGISKAADVKESVAQATAAPKAKSSGSMTRAEWMRCFSEGVNGGNC